MNLERFLELLRRGPLLRGGGPQALVTRPIGALLLPIAAALVVPLALPAIRTKRSAAFQESQP